MMFAIEQLNLDLQNLQSLTHNEFEKCIRVKHIIQNPDFSDIESIFYEDITSQNKNFELHLFDFDLKLLF